MAYSRHCQTLQRFIDNYAVCKLLWIWLYCIDWVMFYAYVMGNKMSRNSSIDTESSLQSRQVMVWRIHPLNMAVMEVSRLWTSHELVRNLDVVEALINQTCHSLYFRNSWLSCCWYRLKGEIWCIFSTNPGKVTPPTESHNDSEDEIWINNEMMKIESTWDKY